MAPSTAVAPQLPAPVDHRATGGLVPAHLIDRAKEYARASKSDGTRRTYASAWRIFSGWCAERGLTALPAGTETVVAWIADAGDRLRPVTVKKILSAVSQAHQVAGHPTPTTAPAVRLVMQGLRRTKGTAGRPKAALRIEHVKKIVTALPDTAQGARDKAIILLGFAGGLRRSEIVGLDVSDVAFEPEGAVLTLRRSKRDQEGVGRRIPIPLGRHPETCPVTALRGWMAAGGVTAGPLFHRLDRGGHRERLDGRGVAHVVQRAARKAGLDAVLFAGHSLRRGFATEAARGGADERDIARTTGHRSLVVLRGYVEEGRLFESAAAKVLDL